MTIVIPTWVLWVLAGAAALLVILVVVSWIRFRQLWDSWTW